MNKGGIERRKYPRLTVQYPIRISDEIFGETIDISQGGVSFYLNKPLTTQERQATLVFSEQDCVKTDFQIVWNRDCGDDGTYRYGVALLGKPLDKYQQLITQTISPKNISSKKFPRFGLHDYDEKSIQKRRKWMEEQSNCQLKYIGGKIISGQEMKGNIEHPIGISQMPLGIAGPILINGEYAKGSFYIPLATTEGALVKTYHRGMRVVTEAGGVNVKILKDGIHITPAFFVGNILNAQNFVEWVQDNFLQIKTVAESTTSHGKLLSITPYNVGSKVLLRFLFYTEDAQGLNMVNKATNAACQMISQETKRKYILRSDMSGIKKVSTMNIHNGQGKTVIADITIPRKMLRLLQITPESICRYQESWKGGATFSGIIGGINVHVANLLGAVFIACGQDVADIVMSHAGILTYEITEEKDLYVSLYLANLMVGTIGGGTSLGTHKECLELIGCYGQGNVKKFAEIITAAALAGDIACLAALDHGSYVRAHETYGRNRPGTKETEC